ncbi:MAG: 2-oxoacid:acceptor oxidoreductase family protein [Eggerthellaceae bacterium]|nr:2-oxoacid:acceptor oxidoreductase family protein [Eggerthellaceae bacterium]
MINILLTGVGGQGTVLAAKLLAQAALSRGWQLRSAETIGMAQRGGSVISHVRMGNLGETVFEPLLAYASADLIVAFEPAEAARVLPYLAAEGVLVSASSAIAPVSAALSTSSYEPKEVLTYLAAVVPHFFAVDDASICEKLGSRKVLNTLLLARALSVASLEIGVEDLKAAICALVKPQYIDLNLAAVEAAE